MLVAGPSALLSSAAHSAAGGCLTVVGVVATTAVLTGATWTQLTRERSFGFLLGWVTVCQLLGHGLLELGCSEPGHGSAAAPRMLALHAAAALAVSLLLAYGERRVWALAHALAALATRLERIATPRLAAAVRAIARVWLPSSEAPRTPRRSTWCSPRPVRRGPPRLALLVA